MQEIIRPVLCKAFGDASLSHCKIMSGVNEHMRCYLKIYIGFRKYKLEITKIPRNLTVHVVIFLVITNKVIFISYKLY